MRTFLGFVRMRDGAVPGVRLHDKRVPTLSFSLMPSRRIMRQAGRAICLPPQVERRERDIGRERQTPCSAW